MTAELIGTAFLLAAVVGSGVMGFRLSGGNDGLALLANSLATGGALLALILAFGPASGAHLNPLVSLVAAMAGEIPWREVPGYVIGQIVGAFLGVGTAHAMFGLAVFSTSRHARGGLALVLSEAVATFGLLCVVRLAVGRTTVAIAVAAYITAAYWFTSSTSFANPAVTLARAATDTFAGVVPRDVPGLIAGQLLGAAAAVTLVRWLRSEMSARTARGRMEAVRDP